MAIRLSHRYNFCQSFQLLVVLRPLPKFSIARRPTTFAKVDYFDNQSFLEYVV